MATHRDEGAGYPGQTYPTPEYPTSGGYPPGSQPEHRSAERIPRYSADPPAPAAGQQPARPGVPQPDESLRLDAGDLPQPPQHTAPYPVTPPPAAQKAPPQQPPEQPAALSDLLHDATQYTEPVPGYPPAAIRQSAGGGHHPRLAWGLGALAILFDLPVVVILVRSMVAPSIGVGGVVAGLFLLPGIPLFAAGLYHLFSGHLAVRPGEGLAALARRPVALLVIGLVLLVAGAIAAG